MSYARNIEFDAGAMARLNGKTITQAQKHLTRRDELERNENRRGWFAMDEFLALAAMVSPHAAPVVDADSFLESHGMTRAQFDAGTPQGIDAARIASETTGKGGDSDAD